MKKTPAERISYKQMLLLQEVKKKKKRPLLSRTVEVESENGDIIFHGKKK